MNESNNNKGGAQPLLCYFYNGKVVFTEEYHKLRGHCCGNGCKHCPFTPTHLKGSSTIKK